GQTAAQPGQASADRHGPRRLPRRLEKDRPEDRVTGLRGTGLNRPFTASAPDGAMPNDALLITAAPDVANAIARWQRHLAGERRLSAKTLEAYARDVAQFTAFLTAHLAGPPKLADLAALTTADIRAFMAARRNDGAGSRTLARGIAGIRSLVRFL